jgi:hypothetical protein
VPRGPVCRVVRAAAHYVTFGLLTHRPQAAEGRDTCHRASSSRTLHRRENLPTHVSEGTWGQSAGPGNAPTSTLHMQRRHRHSPRNLRSAAWLHHFPLRALPCRMRLSHLSSHVGRIFTCSGWHPAHQAPRQACSSCGALMFVLASSASRCSLPAPRRQTSCLHHEARRPFCTPRFCRVHRLALPPSPWQTLAHAVLRCKSVRVISTAASAEIRDIAGQGVHRARGPRARDPRAALLGRLGRARTARSCTWPWATREPP